MLIQRIKVLWTVLGCKNTEIALFAECSASHISKICSGKRVLHENGQAALHFSLAILRFAQEHDRCSVLCRVTGLAEEELSAQSIHDWLFGAGNIMADVNLLEQNESMKKDLSFAGKLNSMMQLLDVSNVRLSRVLNVDASLVSRLRHGARSMTSNAQLMGMLCAFFAGRMQQLSYCRDAATLTGIGQDLLESPEAAEHLQEWFVGENKTIRVETHTMEYMQMFLPMTALPSEDTLAQIVKAAEEKKADTYWGIDGMRNAARRLLAEAALKGSGEVYMYADQSMQWLLEDREVLRIWYMCCAVCISRNVRLIVIHDLNRNAEDMAKAMQVWVPLYMTGVVEPYYCTLNRGSRFNHMLFLCPDTAAISSVHVQGAESNNFYDYITDPRKLTALYNEFRSLISHSEKLINVYSPDGMYNYYETVQDGMQRTNFSVALLNAPSTVTMPEQILKNILERGNVAEEKRKLILETHKRTRELLKNGSVTELFSLPELPQEADRKFRIRIGESREEEQTYYTREEYREHIREIIRLCETQPNYHACLIVKSPFQGMRIIIMEEKAAVIRLHEPYTVFVVSSSVFAKAFAKNLLDYYLQNSVPKEKLIAYLKEYLGE